jgi:hypothetical protein
MRDCSPASARKRDAGRLTKIHCEPTCAQIAPKLLGEQQLYIWLVVDHKDNNVHERSPDLASIAAPRGRTILNSVNSPGCVSTSIDPACCLTMMS